MRWHHIALLRTSWRRTLVDEQPLDDSASSCPPPRWVTKAARRNVLYRKSYIPHHSRLRRFTIREAQSRSGRCSIPSERVDRRSIGRLSHPLQQQITCLDRSKSV